MVPEAARGRLARMADHFQVISDTLSSFRDRVGCASPCAIEYNVINGFGVSTPALRQEQIGLLEHAVVLEEENCRLAEEVLGICDTVRP